MERSTAANMGLSVWRSHRILIALAALGGFSAVAAGAFAAHTISDPRARELLHTGALYGFVHVLAALSGVSLTRLDDGRRGFAPTFFLTGVLLFCGSLFALALGAPHWVGAFTPFGGVAFLLGWAALGWSAWRMPPNAPRAAAVAATPSDGERPPIRRAPPT